MADVRPFIGVRYSQTGDQSDLLAPPYDVIDPVFRADLAGRNPANVVEIDLPEAPDDEDKYAHAADIYRGWLEQGTLVRDGEPGFTIYHQTFPGPDGAPTTRKGLIAGVRLEAFDAGIILPHEYTLRGPKEDRLSLFTSTGATASQVFTVYDDPEFQVDALLARVTEGAPLMTAHSDDGVDHAVWVTSDAEIAAGIAAFFESRTLLIADGHHRYETSLHYRDQQRERLGTDDVPANYAAIYLANMADPGTVVYPIHRLVRDVAGFSAGNFVERLDELFERRPLRGESLAEMKACMAEHAADTGQAIYGAVFPDRTGWTFGLDPAKQARALSLIKEREPLRSLDVTVLHRLVLDRTLGIDAAALAAQSNVDYIKNESTFLTKMGTGDYQVGFLLPAPNARHVAEVAAAGQRMPQKSTYFFPKILSGVVIYPWEG